MKSIKKIKERLEYLEANYEMLSVSGYTEAQTLKWVLSEEQGDDPVLEGIVCEVMRRAEDKGDPITDDETEIIANRILSNSDYLWDTFDGAYESHRDDVWKKAGYTPVPSWCENRRAHLMSGGCPGCPKSNEGIDCFGNPIL